MGRMIIPFSRRTLFSSSKDKTQFKSYERKAKAKRQSQKRLPFSCTKIRRQNMLFRRTKDQKSRSEPEQELKKLLKKAGYRLEDVFLMTCTPQKDYYIVPLDPKERSN